MASIFYPHTVILLVIPVEEYTLWGSCSFSTYRIVQNLLDKFNETHYKKERAVWKSCGTNCTGGGVGPRAGLDGCSEEKISCPHRGLNPELFSLHRIAIPTTLARPHDILAKGYQIRYRDLEHHAAQCFIGKRTGCVRSVVRVPCWGCYILVTWDLHPTYLEKLEMFPYSPTVNFFIAGAACSFSGNISPRYKVGFGDCVLCPCLWTKYSPHHHPVLSSGLSSRSPCKRTWWPRG